MSILTLCDHVETGREVFDRESALDGFGGDSAFLEEVIDAFREEAPTWFTALQTAIDRLDSAAFRRLGHSIRGASSTLCVGEVERAARSIETFQSMGSPEIASELLRALRASIQRLDSQWQIASAAAAMPTDI